jgi:hypothetical protein
MAVEEIEAAELARVAAAYRAAEQIYGGLGSPLYAALCRAGADDPEILALTSHGLEHAGPIHVFTAVHYLLLGNPSDPLARFFPTLVDDPAPPEQAWPDFARYCRKHTAEIRRLLTTRPVQMTYVERCRTLLPALCAVAEQAGEPLNLIEIGCSAGVLLTFDRYAYELRPGEHVGPADATIRLKGRLLGGGPELRVPRIGKRTGIDLNVMDPHSRDDRRWLLATCYPELRTEQAHLDQAMDLVAATEIAWRQGNALEHLAEALAETPEPVCVYHSACLFYWDAAGKAALDAQLRAASRDRTIHRLGIEPSERYDQWQSGRGGEEDATPGASGEIVLTTYRGGEADARLLGRLSPDFGTVWWLAATQEEGR